MRIFSMINTQISVFAFYAARVILGLLALTSVLSIAVFIERMVYFRKRLLKDAAPLLKQIERADSIADLIRIMVNSKKAETNIILLALRGSPKSGDAFVKRVDGFFYTEKERWSRYSTFLGSVGSNAPFVGLLGTVFGILKAFVDLSITATGGPQVVMTGIAEALIATAAGLLVAIPAVIFFNLCKVRVKKSVVNLQSMVAFISAKDCFNPKPLHHNHPQKVLTRPASLVHKVN
jgi:biopolymer transport protein ExbB/TolQ